MKYKKIKNYDNHKYTFDEIKIAIVVDVNYIQWGCVLDFYKIIDTTIKIENKWLELKDKNQLEKYEESFIQLFAARYLKENRENLIKEQEKIINGGNKNE